MVIRGCQDPRGSIARPTNPPTQWLPKRIFFSLFFRCVFLIDFCSILGRFSLPTCFPKSTKIVQKSMPRCLPKLISSFYSFLFDFDSQLGRPNLVNSSPHYRESMIFPKSPFEVNIDFLFDSGANLPLFSFPKSVKIVSKVDLGWHVA